MTTPEPLDETPVAPVEVRGGDRPEDYVVVVRADNDDDQTGANDDQTGANDDQTGADDEDPE